MAETNPAVAIIMGSQSDWPTMKHTADTLAELGIGHEARIISAHRTPDRLHAYLADAPERGLKVIIAGAGGAAHLAGVTASLTTLPVLGVPMKTDSLGGQDSLYSIVQMPGGIPVGTLGIGRAGAVHAALLAAGDTGVHDRLVAYRKKKADAVPIEPSDDA